MNSTNINRLEDFKINVKIKLSLLWTSVTFIFLYGDYFELYVPQKTQGLVDGNNLLDSPMKLFFAALLLAIPAFMIVLSFLLKPKMSRVLNIIFGTFFTLMMILIAVTSFQSTSWRAFYVFYALLESSITAIIVWVSFKWPSEISNLT